MMDREGVVQPSLPAEILTMILGRVERNKDLLACRQVNRIWHSISTPICRHHFVRLNLCKVLGENPKRNLQSFYSTFKNLEDDLPWSACELDVDTSSNGICRIPLIQIRKFIHLFGSHIHELTISGGNIHNNVGLLLALDGVPNIEYLDISWINITRPIQEPFTAQLKKLKGLIISSIQNDHSFRFFELLLNCPEAQLRSLQLKIEPAGWQAERCEVLSTLIAGIPVLHLEFMQCRPELFIQLTRKGVQAHQLIINFNTPRVPTPHSSLEEFLQNTAESLQILTLINHDAIDIQRENDLLTIPTLPKLTYLGVKAGEVGGGLPRGGRDRFGSPPFSNVTPFTPGQFPKLTKVNARIYSSFGRMTLFDMGGPFLTVTDLVLSDRDVPPNPLETDWERIFPNLKQLHADITGSGLRLILTKFQNLERLSLSLQWPSHELGDVSTILLGGRQFGIETEGPSLLLLTCLKEFKLLVYPEQYRISDDFVHFYLLRIPRLENLCLENVIISDVCKEKLQKYHRKAEIYDHRNPKQYQAPPSKFHELR